MAANFGEKVIINNGSGPITVTVRKNVKQGKRIYVNAPADMKWATIRDTLLKLPKDPRQQRRRRRKPLRRRRFHSKQPVAAVA
jgi:uncharacterized protein (DUF1786 family)